MKDVVIIVAGGVGDRMQADMPKQFLELRGLPVIFHTLKRFADYHAGLEFIVVIHPEYIEFFEELCKRYHFEFNGQVVAGGRTRYESVQNGIRAIQGDVSVVAIHDAVRPFVSGETLDRCFGGARAHGTAIPVVPVFDSLRQFEGIFSEPVNRELYRIVQTPQCFDAKLIKDAYNQEYRKSFTDDASVVEHMDIRLHLVEGNRLNFKLTTREDMELAQAICGEASYL
ncbi:MAG: 2-C-methyl-D-erythritol 4-phosphate cytidylyltransferase [Flavobacteriales bacterium]|nr:2-C-methyl-D-erythritol 4-phosphate cytidylyltransferase [Flavobacteriales bacterium]